MSTALVWFRNDLRLHDHQPLLRAIQKYEKVIPCYCLDTRQLEMNDLGFPRTGDFRLKFIFESITSLRQALRKSGGDLIIRYGIPEIEIPRLADETGAQVVYAHREVADEEVRVESAMLEALKQKSISTELFNGNSLFDPEQLPFTVRETPNVFTQFRKIVEKKVSIASALDAPPSLPAIESSLDTGNLPSLEDLGIELPEPDSRAAIVFHGGEDQALQRLEHYLWETHALSHYKTTRNGLLGSNYSSKFSPWLARGCISPRKIHAEVRHYEQKIQKNQSTYWLIFELLWREYFRLVMGKYGNRLFQAGGIQNIKLPLHQDIKTFRKWKDGQTGMPFIDANMRELNQTGFMSNRGRQNVASFLVKDLRIDWRLGASYFESKLIDYDVHSNWGNWNYVAGVGNDPREDRYFNVLSQAKRYDPNGDYVRHWLPELRQVPSIKIHEVFRLNDREQSQYKVRLGIDYPNAIYVADAWAKYYA